jgi:hypothetical protein
MSDFLTRLAARGLHRTETIAPRLASLFEPVQEPATSQSAVIERSETAVVSNSAISIAASEAATSPAVVPPRRVGEAGRVLYSKAAAPVAQSVPTSAAERVLDERLAGMKGPPLGHLRANELTRQGPDALDASFSLIGHTLATQDGQTSHVPRLQPSAPVRASPAAPAPVLEERLLLIAAKPSAGLELGNFALVARADRGAAQTSHPPESSFTAAEPSIQVTIGRIEVRAEREPVRSARAAPAARAKPLDDYLRERSRRGSQ